MPYSEKQVVKAALKPSPSMVNNNLCYAAGNLMYAHVRQACTFAANTVTAGTPVAVRRVESSHMDVIYSIRACCDKSATYVVLATEAGIQIWDKNAQALLHTWAFSEGDKGPTGTGVFARGVAINMTAAGQTNICFGSSSGQLYVLEITEDAKFKPPVSFASHSTPITAMGSAYQSRQGAWKADMGCELVTCDEEGKVTVWEASASNSYKPLHTITSSNIPCVSVAVRNGFIVAARSNGVVQIYGLKDGKLRAEITAHSRFLSGMDIHPNKDIIATVSEDCTLNVWTLPIGGNKASNLLSTCWMHSPLTGACFCGPNSDDLAVVAYDTDEVQIFKGA